MKSALLSDVMKDVHEDYDRDSIAELERSVSSQLTSNCVTNINMWPYSCGWEAGPEFIRLFNQAKEQNKGFAFILSPRSIKNAYIDEKLRSPQQAVAKNVPQADYTYYWLIGMIIAFFIGKFV